MEGRLPPAASRTPRDRNDDSLPADRTAPGVHRHGQGVPPTASKYRRAVGRTIGCMLMAVNPEPDWAVVTLSRPLLPGDGASPFGS